MNWKKGTLKNSFIGCLTSILRLFLLPLGFLYWIGFYCIRKKIKPQKLPSLTIWSVGNLSVGGTGKTPMVLRLISDLQFITENKIPLVVLSRGYKGKLSSCGGRVEETSSSVLVGDEPLLIKKRFPNVEVIIGRDRVEAFKQFYDSKNGLPIILLDDGFQHFAIKRDWDFVLIDSLELVGNGLLLPAGNLRETVSSLSRANVLIFTRYNQAFMTQERKDKVDTWKLKIQKKFPHLTIFHAIEELAGFYFWQEKNWKKMENLNRLKDKKILAFCGIGNPSAFFQLLESYLKSTIQKKIFPDHHNYQNKDILELLDNNVDYYITTEKDIIKFSQEELNLFKGKIGFLKMELRIHEENWMDFLRTSLKKVQAEHS